MEKDVDEVKKTAYFIKSRIEELDKEVSTEFLFICFIQSSDSWCKSTHSFCVVEFDKQAKDWMWKRIRG